MLSNDLQLARTVSTTVLATRGVHALGTGRYAEAATYGANDKVLGVVVKPEEMSVHIVAAYPEGVPIPQLITRIKERIAPLIGERKVTVVVEDLFVTTEESPDVNL